MNEARDRWEQRYRTGTPPEEASRFIVENAHRIGGRVLDIAGGAGRNALFLARAGASVHVIDISFAALRHTMIQANEQRLAVEAIQADLESYWLPACAYDAIIVVRYLQRSLLGQIRRALRPGGTLLYETFLLRQQEIGRTRHPEFLLEDGELRAAFADFDIQTYREGLLDTDPPAYLAQLAARKPLNGD